MANYDSYTKTSWVNGNTTPLSDGNLNKIEQGIYDNREDAIDLDDRVTVLENKPEPSPISSGSGGSGSWVRFGNVQICWAVVPTTKNGNSSTWGNTWWATGASWTFPKPFSAIPVVTATALDNQSGLFGGSLNTVPSTTGVTVESYASQNFSTCNVYCIAIGFWQ